MDGPVISDEAKAMVGQIIREFVSDPISLHHIREYLVGSGASTEHLPAGDDEVGISELIAPPLFFFSACRRVVPESDLLEDGQHASLGVPGITGLSVMAGTTAEIIAPVRVGDVLHAEERLADLTEKSGRSGPLVFSETNTTYRNQRGVHVASYSMTVVFR
jgi:acyl dehydratase